MKKSVKEGLEILERYKGQKYCIPFINQTKKEKFHNHLTLVTFLGIKYNLKHRQIQFEFQRYFLS